MDVQSDIQRCTAGIVESVVDGTVYTIEGNSGDKVARRSYPIGYAKIVGYGVPAY